MAFETSQPTAHSTPDPGQGGTAVTGDSNTGHASTTSSQGEAGTTDKTCIWQPFQAVAGTIIGITLKYDWQLEGDFFLSSETGDGSASISVQVQYSINSGGAWTTTRTAGDSGVVIGNDTDSGTVPLASGSDTVSIDPATPIANIRVRDRIRASLTLNGDASGAADATLTVSNIRLEVETDDPVPAAEVVNLLVMM